MQDLIPDSPSEPWAAAAVPDQQPPHVPFVASDPSEMQDQVQLRPCSCQPHTCPCCACIQLWRDWCRHFVSRQLDGGPGSHRHTYTSCAGTEDDQGGRAAAVVCGDASVASPNFFVRHSMECGCAVCCNWPHMWGLLSCDWSIWLETVDIGDHCVSPTTHCLRKKVPQQVPTHVHQFTPLAVINPEASFDKTVAMTHFTATNSNLAESLNLVMVSGSQVGVHLLGPVWCLHVAGSHRLGLNAPVAGVLDPEDLQSRHPRWPRQHSCKCVGRRAELNTLSWTC